MKGFSIWHKLSASSIPANNFKHPCLRHLCIAILCKNPGTDKKKDKKYLEKPFRIKSKRKENKAPKEKSKGMKKSFRSGRDMQRSKVVAPKCRQWP